MQYNTYSICQRFPIQYNVEQFRQFFIPAANILHYTVYGVVAMHPYVILESYLLLVLPFPYA